MRNDKYHKAAMATAMAAGITGHAITSDIVDHEPPVIEKPVEPPRMPVHPLQPEPAEAVGDVQLAQARDQGKSVG